MVQVKIISDIPDGKREKLKAFGLKSCETSSLSLEFRDGIWSVQDSKNRKLKIDFDSNSQDYLRKHRGAGEPLAKALGYKEGIRQVLDLSAGLGIDSVFLARIGFRVTGVERNPLLAFLLSEAQEHSRANFSKGLEFIKSESQDFLSSWTPTSPTSAYFDPMYPEKKKKSALPRQEMVLFRELVGDDLDSAIILQSAIKSHLHRIVVKRPLRAPPIFEKPQYHIEMKLIRYDVYFGLEKK